MKPLETVYCSSTARGAHAAPGSSSPGGSAQCLLQGVEGEAAGDLLPVICSQFSCWEVSVRPLFGTHRGREKPEPLQHCPNAAPAGQGAQREQLSTAAPRHSISTASPGGVLLMPPLSPGCSWGRKGAGRPRRVPAPWNRAYSECQQQELCPGTGPFETFVGESSIHSYESQIKQGKIKQGDTRPATQRRRLEAKRPSRELQKPPRWWGRGSLWWKKRALQPTPGGSRATGAENPAQECKPDTALPYLSFSSES